MDCKFTSAFNYSIERMLSTMAGATCSRTERCEWDPRNALAGTVFLRGGLEGRVTLCFPFDTAQRLVSEMLGVSVDRLSSVLVRDGVAEMANIVAGNAKALLSTTPHRFDISLPSVSNFRPSDLAQASGPSTWLRDYATQHGPFCVCLQLLGDRVC